MALSEEQIYQAISQDEDFRASDAPSEGSMREMARDITNRIAQTDPAVLEPGAVIVHVLNPFALVFREYRGDAVLVEGIAVGAENDEESEFEVPSDEIFAVEESPGGVQITVLSPCDHSALFGDDEGG